MRYDQAIFHGDPVRCDRISRIVARHSNSDIQCSILEIGCGTGEQLLSLAQTFPNAQLTGIDTSKGNIDYARALLRSEGVSERVSLIEGDYLTHQMGQFDIVVSYSVLHLIPCPDPMLFSKLASEIAPGGILVNVIPFECLFNRMLFTFRRLLRAHRGRLTDALLIFAGKYLAHKKLGMQELRERMVYMYTLPERIDGHAMRATLESQYGLDLVHQSSEPNPSFAQPKHMLVIYRKRIQ